MMVLLDCFFGGEMKCSYMIDILRALEAGSGGQKEAVVQLRCSWKSVGLVAQIQLKYSESARRQK